MYNARQNSYSMRLALLYVLSTHTSENIGLYSIRSIFRRVVLIDVRTPSDVVILKLSKKIFIYFDDSKSLVTGEW